MVGSISVTLIDDNNRLCEHGYRVGFDNWGKGIVAKHDVENPGSGKAMEKYGMTYKGTLRSHYRRYDGTYSDSKIFGIVVDDFFDK